MRPLHDIRIGGTVVLVVRGQGADVGEQPPRPLPRLRFGGRARRRPEPLEDVLHRVLLLFLREPLIEFSHGPLEAAQGQDDLPALCDELGLLLPRHAYRPARSSGPAPIRLLSGGRASLKPHAPFGRPWRRSPSSRRSTKCPRGPRRSLSSRATGSPFSMWAGPSSPCRTRACTAGVPWGRGV